MLQMGYDGRLQHRIMLHDAAVYCHLCTPPCRVDVPARVFYRLKDEDFVSCPKGHKGTLIEYKRAAASLDHPCGPFIRYGHRSADRQPDTGRP
ncbi:MAG TPA: hypothetical protein VGV16_03450 [Gammaproteobacteria bacterium]|nr:hypothetical protein [Gammaproteobacteria bacterium]